MASIKKDMDLCCKLEIQATEAKTKLKKTWQGRKVTKQEKQQIDTLQMIIDIMREISANYQKNVEKIGKNM